MNNIIITLKSTLTKQEVMMGVGSVELAFSAILIFYVRQFDEIVLQK